MNKAKSQSPSRRSLCGEDRETVARACDVRSDFGKKRCWGVRDGRVQSAGLVSMGRGVREHIRGEMSLSRPVTARRRAKFIPGGENSRARRQRGKRQEGL